MTQETSLALGILKRAMSIEQEKRKFYREALQATQDKKGKETFSILANDELNHYNLIKSRHDNLRLRSFDDGNHDGNTLEGFHSSALIVKVIFDLNRVRYSVPRYHCGKRVSA